MNGKKNVCNSYILIGLVVIYIASEILVLPYLEKIKQIYYFPYDYYFKNSVRVIGMLLTSVLCFKIFSIKMQMLKYKKVFLYFGIGCYVIYYLVLILQFHDISIFLISEFVITISTKCTFVLLIPAIFTAFGIFASTEK